jgi:hypothetical protein
LADGVSVQIRAADFEEGYRASLRLISTAGLVGRLQAVQRVIAAQPNADKLRDAIGEDVTKRWLDPKSVPSATTGSSAATGSPQRYFGAR